jgi:hypothetical protein
LWHFRLSPSLLFFCVLLAFSPSCKHPLSFSLSPSFIFPLFLFPFFPYTTPCLFFPCFQSFLHESFSQFTHLVPHLAHLPVLSQ